MAKFFVEVTYCVEVEAETEDEVWAKVAAQVGTEEWNLAFDSGWEITYVEKMEDDA